MSTISSTTASKVINLPARAASPAKPKVASPKDTLAHSLPSADWATNAAKLRARHAFGPFNGQQPPQNGGLTEPESNTDLDQTGYEKNLITGLGPHVRLQNHQDISKLNGAAIPTSAELDAEFQKLAANPEIPFEYIVDGCYARAHLMCDTMMHDNINSAKMFCMLENPMGGDRLHAENKYMQAEWWYHVAPLSFATDEQNQVQGYIMDPSMSNHPMKAEDWIHKMWDGQANIKVDITRPPQYGPFESDGPNATFEESLQPSHEILAQYSAELAQIKDQYNHDHPDGKLAA